MLRLAAIPIECRPKAEVATKSASDEAGGDQYWLAAVVLRAKYGSIARSRNSNPTRATKPPSAAKTLMASPDPVYSGTGKTG